MKYDLAIIGGGSAGLMAAFRASELGRRVVLIEKNPRLGVKLLLTGGGRCNVTNNIPNYRLMAESFGSPGRFLLSAFSRFGVSETIDFFEHQGLKMKTEPDNKVFPVSDKAGDVLNVFINGLRKTGGVIMTGNPVQDFVLKGKRIEKIILTDGEEIVAANFLIATGGLSYPATGSSGDGYRWLKKFGHTIKPLRPALAPIIVKEKFVADLEGLSLENIILNLYQGNKKIATESGAIIFTSNGLSGPAALNLSRYLDLSAGAKYKLDIDLQPGKSLEDLDQELLKIISSSNKFLKNSLEGILPARLVEIILRLSGLKPERQANSLNKTERKKLVQATKILNLEIKSLAGYEKAMVTAGGVDLKEIDPKTLRSKKIANLFLAGEVLDLVGPTGGYNLQLSWSTGWVVGGAV